MRPAQANNAETPRSTATAAQVLKLHGYNTAFIGKHHNVPMSAMSASGPLDLWPGGLGFEYFYGFLGGDTNKVESQAVSHIAGLFLR